MDESWYIYGSFSLPEPDGVCVGRPEFIVELPSVRVASGDSVIVSWAVDDETVYIYGSFSPPVPDGVCVGSSESVIELFSVGLGSGSSTDTSWVDEDPG